MTQDKKRSLYTIGFYVALLGFIATVIWQFVADVVISPDYMQLMYFSWFCLVVFCYVKMKKNTMNQNLQLHQKISKGIFITFLGLIGIVLILITVLLLGYAITLSR